jgi:hypothetical protein
MFRAKLANLCNDCWLIAVGRQTGNAQNLLFDKVIMQGHALWADATSDRRGTKASEFRDSVNEW